MVRRAGLLAVAAVVLAGVADAQYVRPARMDETGWLAMGAPAGATTGCVGVFLGSPLNLQCAPASGIVYTVATRSLDVTDGRVQAGNVNAIPLPASGAVTVAPKLSPLGGITVVAGSALVDGDALSVGDGVGVVPIEFDVGDGTTGGAVPIILAGDETATQIRDAVKAILDASGRDWTTSAQGADGIGLVRATPGASGGAITEAVADAGFTVNDWTAPTAATTYTYSLQACLADGTCNAAGAASSTAAGVLTLSGYNLNRLTWSAVPGAASYKIRRDVGGATQGVIWSGTATTVDDVGLAGDGTAKPTVDGTGRVTAAGITMATGAGAGKALLSDAAGNASWGAAGITNAAGANVLPKSDGTNLVASSITDDGTTVTTTEPIQLPNGTAAAPGVALGAGGYGFFRASNAISLSLAGSNIFRANTGTGIISIASNWPLTWTSASNNAAGTIDSGISRLGAGAFAVGNGTASNASGSITLATVKGLDGSGTDGAGTDLSLAGGNGLGLGAPGSPRVKTTYPAASSGTGAQTLSDRITPFGKWTTLTESSATNTATITYGASSAVSADFLVTIEANDGTDYQSMTYRVRVNSARKATGDTVSTVGIVDDAGAPGVATTAGGGTLTATFAVVEGAGAVTLTTNAVSSLTQTTLRANVQTVSNGPGVTMAQL